MGEFVLRSGELCTTSIWWLYIDSQDVLTWAFSAPIWVVIMFLEKPRLPVQHFK